MAQNLHQQPARIAAGAASRFQRLFRSLDTGFHTGQVTDLALQPLIEIDQKLDSRDLATINRGNQCRQARPGWRPIQKWSQLMSFPRLVMKGIFFGVGFQKKVERMMTAMSANQIHFEQKMGASGEERSCVPENFLPDPVASE